MLIIGLTGGIGSGKSAVARCFSELGIPVIDADSVAREVVEPGLPALKEIEQRFGSQILASDGRLDRKQLRQIIFSDPQAKADLEAILHPRIRASMWELAHRQTTPYVILEIPLLVETGQNSSVDRVLVVDVPRQLQIERVCARDGMSPQEAATVIAAQIPRQRRLDAADDMIENTGTFSELHTQVENLHRKYLELASHNPA
ncbi:MAG: dephospho-CoA kinase [Sedimenticola sp.]|nr:MAG: dephospho-CoA kinase [Sedimenticola sp.]